MLRFFLSSIIVLTACEGCLHPSGDVGSPGDHTKLAKAVLDSTVKIEVGEGHGSGFFCYQSNTICTAGHVVDSLSYDHLDATVVLHDGKECNIESVTYGNGVDIAILKVACQRMPLVGAVEPARGMRVMTAGNPLTSQWVVSFGYVASLGENVNGQTMFSIDAPVNPGNSGGPIVDMHGRIVGVINAIRTRDGLWAGQGFGTSAHRLLELFLPGD